MTAAALVLSARPDGVRLELRVQPRASRTEITGIRDGRLVVRVTAPPVDRAANDAVIQLLSRALGLSRSSVRLVSGDASRNKVVAVSGLDEAGLRERLAGLLEKASATRPS